MRDSTRIATRSAAALGLIAALACPFSTLAEDGKAPLPDRVVEQNLPPPAPAGAEMRGPRHPLTGRGPDAKAALFGPALWRDTPYALLRESVPRLPVRPRSAVLREIAYRLLAADAAPAGAPEDWALVRAERLAAMGALGEAERIAAGAAAPARAAHARVVIEIALLNRGYRAACDDLAPSPAVVTNAYLERALVACHALSGRHDRAAAALGLMREAGRAPDEIFAALITAQQPDLAQPVATLGRADAWTVALFAETKLAWPEDAARLGTPVLLRAVSLSRNDPVALRLYAGERAFLAGALSHGELAELYAATPVSAPALEQAARLPLERYSAPSRAVMHRAAVAAVEPAERMEILAHWWRLARADRDERLAALATVPLMRDIPASARWRDHAAPAARAWLHAGGLEMAVAWYDVLRAQPFKDMESYNRLHALMALAGADVAAEDLKAWRDRQLAEREFGARRMALAQAFSAALGRPMGFEAAADATPPGAEIAAALRAAESGRPGEALLILATAIGERHTENMSPASLGAAVRILVLAGLANDARRFAIEAALESGF